MIVLVNVEKGFEGMIFRIMMINIKLRMMMVFYMSQRRGKQFSRDSDSMGQHVLLAEFTPPKTRLYCLSSE